MDPLSVGSSVVGLLAFATKTIPLLIHATTSVRDAPKQAVAVRDEILAITSALQSLQPYLLDSAKVVASRVTLFELESLVTTLTGCVTAYSELEALLSNVALEAGMDIVRQIDRAFAEAAVQSIVRRLQSYKSSLTFILTIIQCQSMQEAESQMHALSDLTKEVLKGNQDLSARMKAMEAKLRSASSAAFSSAETLQDDRSTVKVPSKIPSDHEKLENVSPTLAPAFEADLQLSRVYKSSAYRHSLSSLTSSAQRTTVMSAFSKLSLADFPNISVLSLPIGLSEIFNSTWYTFKVTEISNTDNSVVNQLLIAATKLSQSLPPAIALRKSSVKDLRPSTKTQAKISLQIEKDLERQKEEKQREMRVLVLGSHTNEVSAIFTQMKMQYTRSYSIEQREKYRSKIFNYLLCNLELALRRVEEAEFEQYENKAWALFVCMQQEILPGEPIPAVCLPAFTSLWVDGRVRLALAEHGSDQVYGNFDYFFGDISRIFVKDYLPSDQDILRLELRQASMNELSLDIGSVTYRLLDPDKLMKTTRKLLHLFDDMSAVLLVIDISSYNETLLEDSEASRLHEALVLVDSILNSTYFLGAEFVLFFNNVDRFREKIHSGSDPINKWFPEYCGGDTDVQAGLQFFAEMFTRADRVPGRKCCVVYTYPTDTEILRKMDDCIKDALNYRHLHASSI